MTPFLPPVKVDIDGPTSAAFIPWAKRELARQQTLLPTGGRKYNLPNGTEVRLTWGPFANHIRITSTVSGFGRYVFSKPVTEVSNTSLYTGLISVFKGSLAGSKVLELFFPQADNLVEWAHDYTTLVHINTTTNTATLTRAGVSLVVNNIMSLTALTNSEMFSLPTAPLTHPDAYYSDGGVIRHTIPIAPYYRQRHASISADGTIVVLRRSINDGTLLVLRWNALTTQFDQFLVPSSGPGVIPSIWLNPFNGDVYQRMQTIDDNTFQGHLPIYKFDVITGAWSLFRTFTFRSGHDASTAVISSTVVFEPTDQSAHVIWWEVDLPITITTRFTDIYRDTLIIFPALNVIGGITASPPYVFIHGVGDGGRMMITAPDGNFWKFGTGVSDVLQIGVPNDSPGTLSTKGTRWYKHDYSGSLTQVYENGALFWAASGADEMTALGSAPAESVYAAFSQAVQHRPSFKEEDKIQVVYVEAGIHKTTLAGINSVNAGPVTLKKGPSIASDFGTVFNPFPTHYFWHEDLIP